MPAAARWLLLAVAALLAPAGASAEMPTVNSMALRMLDGEALYTAAGGLKPVSDGFWQARFPADQVTSPEVDAARAALAALPLGPDLDAGVYVFAKPFGGQRTASAFVAHKPSLSALIARRWDAFGPLGVTPATRPQQVMEAIDRAPPAARWRAFGLAFGYPDYAVDFFVAAGEEQAATGQFVARDFLSLPTFASDRGRFVYAVPKGHAERDEDRQLKAATAPIFAAYAAWRQAYVGDGKATAQVPWGDWLALPTVAATAPATPHCEPSRPTRPPCAVPRRLSRLRR